MSTQIDTPIEGELVTAARNAIAEFDPFESELAEFRQRYDGVVYDLTDETQNKQARSDRRAVGKVIAKLDKRHAAVKAPLLEATRVIDGRRKELKDGLLEVQGRIKSQLEEHEAKEQARVNDIAARIQDIRDFAGAYISESDSGTIQSAIDRLAAIEIDDSFDEWKGSAMLAKVETMETLQTVLVARQEREAELAELARLRAEKEAKEREEREARIAAEAAEKAKREAEEKARAEREAAERARIRAEEKAKREIAEANARAQRAAIEEREKLAREQAQAKAEEEKRSKQRQHRIKIQREAADSLDSAVFLDDGTSDTIIDAIAAGKVAHVRIQF